LGKTDFGIVNRVLGLSRVKFELADIDKIPGFFGCDIETQSNGDADSELFVCDQILQDSQYGIKE